MRKTLVAILILACAASGCASMNSGRDNANSIDRGRLGSCYGGPVYVPC